METSHLGCGDGSTLPCHRNSGFGKVGAGNCSGELHAVVLAAMYQKGIEIYCAPTVDDRDRLVRNESAISLARADAMCCSLARFKFRSNFADSLHLASISEEEAASYRPFGEIICRTRFDQEQNPHGNARYERDYEKANYDPMRLAGIYSRPDLFQLERE